MAEHFSNPGQENIDPQIQWAPDSSKAKEVNRSHLFLPLNMASSRLYQICGPGGKNSIWYGEKNLLFFFFLLFPPFLFPSFFLSLFFFLVVVVYFLMVSPILDQIARKMMGVEWVGGKPKICT